MGEVGGVCRTACEVREQGGAGALLVAAAEVPELQAQQLLGCAAHHLGHADRQTQTRMTGEQLMRGNMHRHPDPPRPAAAAAALGSSPRVAGPGGSPLARSAPPALAAHNGQCTG